MPYLATAICAAAEEAQMFVLGLTGGIACGKSAAASFFKELGVPVLDSDAVRNAHGTNARD